MNYIHMERNRSKNVKPLGAAREKTRSEINQALENRMVLAGPKFPPPRSFVKKEVQVRRFLQNAAVTNQAFSLANGHDQFLVVTNVTGAAVPYVDSWRIKSISCWCISEGNNASSVSISPVGTDLTSNMRNDKEAIWHCTSRSQSEPGYMKIVTSKAQPLGSWHYTSNTNFAGTLFQMNIGVNAGASNNRVTMDIEFETITNYVGLPLGYGVTTATTTLGTVGARPILSGFSPQGINNLG
jgi:hypothetical protein